jgi:predicted Zn-dependent protease
MTPSPKKPAKETPESLSAYILRKLKKEGADDVVVSSGAKRSLMIKYSNNLVNTTKTVDLTTLGIFMAMDKRLVSTNILDLNRSCADATLKKLVSFAKSAEKT